MKMKNLFYLVVSISFAGRSLALPNNTDALPPLSPKIVFGNEVDIHNYPYHVSTLIIRKSDEDANEKLKKISLHFPVWVSIVWTHGKFYSCGAVIITRKHVLTAAHCVVLDSGWEVGPENIEIVAGRSVISENGTELSINNIIVHPDYEIDTKFNDIAIIELTQLIHTTRAIGIITLVETRPATGTKCTAIGFGATYYGGPVPNDKLLAVDIPIQTSFHCKVMYFKSSKIHDGQICAGYSTGMKDACVGDSGGPFVCNRQLGGVISAGLKCGEFYKPGIYTDISYYRQWISRVINETSNMTLY